MCTSFALTHILRFCMHAYGFCVQVQKLLCYRYPVTLSIENHCSIEQQTKMAEYMTQIFGGNLFPVKSFHLCKTFSFCYIVYWKSSMMLQDFTKFEIHVLEKILEILFFLLLWVNTSSHFWTMKNIILNSYQVRSISHVDIFKQIISSLLISVGNFVLNFMNLKNYFQFIYSKMSIKFLYYLCHCCRYVTCLHDLAWRPSFTTWTEEQNYHKGKCFYSQNLST